MRQKKIKGIEFKEKKTTKKIRILFSKGQRKRKKSMFFCYLSQFPCWK